MNERIISEDAILDSSVNGWILDLGCSNILSVVVGSFGNSVRFRDVITSLSQGDDFYEICRRNRSPESEIVYAAFDKKIKTEFVRGYLRRLYNGKIVFMPSTEKTVASVNLKALDPRRSFFYSRMKACIFNLNAPKIFIPTESNQNFRTLENRRKMLEMELHEGLAVQKESVECEIRLNVRKPQERIGENECCRLWLTTMRVAVLSKNAALPEEGYECKYF